MEDEKNRAFFALERALQSKRLEDTSFLNEENEYRVMMARLNATRESLEESMREELGEKIFVRCSTCEFPGIFSFHERNF